MSQDNKARQDEKHKGSPREVAQNRRGLGFGLGLPGPLLRKTEGRREKKHTRGAWRETLWEDTNEEKKRKRGRNWKVAGPLEKEKKKMRRNEPQSGGG